MKKVLFIFILIILIAAETSAVFITRVRIYPDYLFTKAVKFQEENNFEKAEKYYRKADKAGNVYAKCAMFRMVYDNIKDNEKIEIYKTEYKRSGMQCKSFALDGIWND